ncbi:hypothetical protein [Pseudonocardia sp.]|uniref:hypothetical protein n=1 Tax=Pseudonocardia sp. TaxID=60912 RepID=UPI003D112452
MSPPVMWTMRRVRLHRIGPAAARFVDVTLELTGADGQPLHSILWLRNGGGKSTVLSLICAVVRPHRRDFLATSTTGKHLEDYVLGSDTAHVVVEWSGPGGATLVTGAVYEWADRVQPADPNRDHDRLGARWYVFRSPPASEATLDALPFDSGETPTPLRDFVSAVKRWGAVPDCGAAVTDSQDRWAQLLDDHGLDPSIFTAILQMNATEGGIEGQFQFRGPDQFVRYLLELIVDPEVPAAVSQILEKVREGLAARPEILADLAFADEAAPLLGELAAARAAHDRAGAAAGAAESTAVELAGALAAAIRRAEADAAGHAERVATLAALAAGHDADAADDRRAEAGARHRAAAARVAAARLRAAALADEQADASALVAGWNAVVTVDAAREARRRVVSLEEQLAAATAEAAPLRARLDEAAAGYARALDAGIAALGARAAGLDAEVAQAREAERAARAASQAASEQRGVLAGELTAVTQALAGLEADLAAAAAHLDHAPGAGVDAAAVEDAVARHEQADADAADELDHLAAERVVLRERRQELTASADGVAAARRAAERTAETTAARSAELRDRVTELVADERLRTLAGGTDVDPVAEAADLAALLTAAVARAERERVELAVAEADDERALATLGADRLLPPTLDVVRAADVLDRAAIPVTTGWRYLADSVPPERRADLMAAAPALAGGLLVHEDRDLPAARTALTAAGLRPTSPVVLATTRDLEGAVGGDVTGWLLPPAAALTDRAAAGAEIDRREAARAHRADADAALVARRDADADLRRRLETLRADCPPGTLDALDAAAAEAAEAVATADADLARISAEVAAVGAREADADTRRGELERARRSATAAIATLSSLLPRVRDAAARRARAAELPALIAARGAEVSRETGAEAAARDAATAASEQVTAVRRVLGEQHEVRASLPDPGPSAQAPEPLDDARRAWESADRAYRREVSESALAVALEEARRALAAPAARVADLRPAIRDRAEALLDGPDGADPATRDAAAARAQAAAERLTSAGGELRAEQRAADAELAAHPAADDEDLPDDPGELDAVRTRALDEAAGAAARAAEHLTAKAAAQDSARDTEALRGNARERATGLTHLLELLRVEPPDGGPDTPDVGSLDDAHTAVTAARAAVDAALAEARKASRSVEDVARRIVVWAASDRFAAVKPDVRDRFRVADVAGELAPVADTLAADLAVYADNLRDRLTDLEADKAVVVTAMTGMVRQALRSLARAQALSELPPTLGEWAGQRFLEVGPRAGVETADAVVRDRCARLVDALTARGAEVPRGLELLWQATDAVVGDGNWKARVLKPSTTFAVERVSVERMRKWSGGEKVTISLLLFCMVAKLRATSRGRDVPGLGALPLDNPLGKANYVVFLDLQRKVAAANGVQLIFLTGVGDLKAVGRFPNIIRMRNVAGRGRQYVRQEERILADADPSDAVDTTRVWREDPVMTLM